VAQAAQLELCAPILPMNIRDWPLLRQYPSPEPTPKPYEYTGPRCLRCGERLEEPAYLAPWCWDELLATAS